MEERHPESTSVDHWSERIARSLEERRENARHLLQAERDRILRIESSLDQQIQLLTRQIEDDRQELAQRDGQLDRQSAELARQAEVLTQQQDDLAARQRQWESQQAETAARHDAMVRDLETRIEQLDHDRREFQQATRQLQTERDQLQTETDTLRLREQELAQRVEDTERLRNELRQLERETRDQRRHVAQQLRTQRAEQLAELEQRRAELIRLAADEDRQLAGQLAETTARADRLQQELDEAREEFRQLEEAAQQARREFQELHAQREQLQTAHALERDNWQRELTHREQQLSQCRQQLEQLQQDDSTRLQQAEIEALRQAADQAADDVQRLTAELTAARTAAEERDFAAREALAIAHREIEELATLRQQLDHASDSQDGDPGEWPQRYELVVQDLRELKAENRRLTDQLAQASKGAAVHAAPAHGFDWEAQKQRLLAQLEEDFDGQDAGHEHERMTIEGTIAITDEVVAAKDKEIAELRELLDQQTGNIGNLAVGAAAIAEMLDQDELIRTERENLAKLQDEWRAKLRQAEMEMSVERARLARERTALDEQLRLLEQRPQSTSSSPKGGSVPPVDGASPPSDKPSRRWMARLGLRDD